MREQHSLGQPKHLVRGLVGSELGTISSYHLGSLKPRRYSCGFLLPGFVSGFSNPDLATLSSNTFINIGTFLALMGFGCYITYRGLDATQKIQTVFIIFQLVVLAIFAGVALYKAVTNTGFANLAPTLEWFNPFGIESFSAFLFRHISCLLHILGLGRCPHYE